MHDHMVKPGKYFLNVMTYQRGNIHYTITLPQSEIIFKANAGEVVYIGDALTLKFEDNYDDAVKYSKEARPEITRPT